MVRCTVYDNICVCTPSALFVSIGAIAIRHAHADCVEIVINQATFQLIVHFQTCPRNKLPTSMETEHHCDLLKEESVLLVPGAQVYERGNVMISYLTDSNFLLCVFHCTLFPLGLTSFTEDQYTFSLGPCS